MRYEDLGILNLLFHIIIMLCYLFFSFAQFVHFQMAAMYRLLGDKLIVSGVIVHWRMIFNQNSKYVYAFTFVLLEQCNS